MPADDEEDAALVRAHLAGDQTAFPLIYARYRDRTWAVAMRTVGDADEAAEVLQEAWLKAFRSISGFRGDARLSTWLHRIIVNEAIDRGRRRPPRPAATATGEPPDLPDPRDLVAERELSLDVRRALATLPEEQRIAVVLTDLVGLPVEEVAAVLEIPEGTVKSRCSRGRARLALRLGYLRNPTPPAAVPPGGGDG